MDKPTAGLRKRQQISRANRVMLLWIAGVSVVVGVSVVLIVFLVQKIVFDEKVISEKNNTVSILKKNISTVDALKENISVRNTSSALKLTQLTDTSSPIQSVLDALPADANATALAASLQTKLLTGVPGVVIESLSVAQPSDSDTKANVRSATDEIDFAFAVSAAKGNYSALGDVLQRLQKSIRPINITNLTIEAQGNKIVMSAKGVSYYELGKTVELTTKVVKP